MDTGKHFAMPDPHNPELHPSGEAAAPPSFEGSLAELQRIVDDLESGALGLEESLKEFERGMSLLRHCYALLTEAEQRVELLTSRDAEGNPLTQPFDASATHPQTTARARRRPRSSSTAPADDEPCP